MKLTNKEKNTLRRALDSLVYQENDSKDYTELYYKLNLCEVKEWIIKNVSVAIQNGKVELKQNQSNAQDVKAHFGIKREWERWQSENGN